MKQTVSEQALAMVEKKIDDLKGRLSPQDAAAATGITVSEASDALARLMELYVTRVTHNDQGNILFAFEMPLRRRGTKTAKETWAQVRMKIWRGFKVFYKVWIGLMVIVYFGVMVIALIAIMIAMSAASNSDDDDNPMSGMVGGLFRMLGEGLRFAFLAQVLTPGGYGIDNHGYRYREAQTPRAIKEKKKSFIIAIYDLALGPERLPPDPMANEQEVASFLRAEQGVLTSAEIVSLSGATMDQAEERMADYLVRFNGEPTITDEGVVVGEFTTYISGRTSETGAAIIPWWEEFEAPYEHSGNSTGRNVGVIAMIAFTLVASLGMLGGGLERLGYYGSFFSTTVAAILLGWLPILFSATFLLISLLRLPGVARREKARLGRNREKRVMRTIFQLRLWNATADDIFQRVESSAGKDIDRATTEQVLQGLLPKLQGEIQLGPNGEAIYSFTRLQHEIEAAEKHRRVLGQH